MDTTTIRDTETNSTTRCASGGWWSRSRTVNRDMSIEDAYAISQRFLSGELPTVRR